MPPTQLRFVLQSEPQHGVSIPPQATQPPSMHSKPFPQETAQAAASLLASAPPDELPPLEDPPPDDPPLLPDEPPLVPPLPLPLPLDEAAPEELAPEELASVDTVVSAAGPSPWLSEPLVASGAVIDAVASGSTTPPSAPAGGGATIVPPITSVGSAQ
jgi:hypothetical protein